MFRRSIILMDRLAPGQGAFPYALDLAHRLRLPIYGVSSRAWTDRLRNMRKNVPGVTNPSEYSHSADEQDTQANLACAKACATASVPWKWSRFDEHPLVALRDALAPDDLLIFDQDLPATQKAALLRHSLFQSAPAILICPSTWTSFSRAVLVDQGRGPSDAFLVKAASLCEHLGMETVVLTVARTERQARRRQEANCRSLTNRGLHAFFDSLITTEIRVAVSCVARWRNCQLIVVPREDSRPWWRWLRGDSTDWLTSVTGFASLLSLPCSGGDCAYGATT